MQPNSTRRFATFYLGERIFGIDVMEVQEVIRQLPITKIHLANPYVKGLVNLRGQIATAIGLKELLNLDHQNPEETMNVICKREGELFSLVVDKIGDVLELENSGFEGTPDTVEQGVRKCMKGVYKLEGTILSVLETKKIMACLESKERTT